MRLILPILFVTLVLAGTTPARSCCLSGHYRALNDHLEKKSKGQSPILGYEEIRNRGAHGTVIVRFAVGRDGMLLWSDVILSSCVAIIDEDALATVRNAQPYPVAPENEKAKYFVGNKPFHYLPRHGTRAIQPLRDYRGECLTS